MQYSSVEVLCVSDNTKWLAGKMMLLDAWTRIAEKVIMMLARPREGAAIGFALTFLIASSIMLYESKGCLLNISSTVKPIMLLLYFYRMQFLLQQTAHRAS
jgi:hypothetical protein